MNSITSVPALSIAGMVFSALISVCAVVPAFIYGKRTLGGSVKSCLIGVGTFILFALVLEGLVHNLVYPTTVGQKIWSNTWLYALYGGAAAAIFEETGRIFAAKVFLRRKLATPEGFMYGVGHGGVEAIVVGAVTQISNISLALLINAGGAKTLLGALSGAQYDAAAEQLGALCSADGAAFFLAGYERVLAVAVHICLSLIMFRGLREHKPALCVLCYVLHFALDAITVLVNSAFGIYAVEAFLTVFVLLTVLLTGKLAPLPRRSEETEL